MGKLSLKNLGTGYVLFCVLFFCNFVIALAVIGLYATDVQRGNEERTGVNSKWVYGVVVGALSAVTCLVWFVPKLIGLAGILAPIWNLIVFILYISLFGVFAAMFIKEDPKGDGFVMRMKNAVWVDLAGAILWFFTAIVSLVYWTRHRDLGVTRFTGRARV